MTKASNPSPAHEKLSFPHTAALLGGVGSAEGLHGQTSPRWGTPGQVSPRESALGGRACVCWSSHTVSSGASRNRGSPQVVDMSACWRWGVMHEF